MEILIPILSNEKEMMSENNFDHLLRDDKNKNPLKNLRSNFNI